MTNAELTQWLYNTAVDKFNSGVAPSTGRSPDMTVIDPSKTSLEDFQTNYWNQYGDLNKYATMQDWLNNGNTHPLDSNGQAYGTYDAGDPNVYGEYRKDSEGNDILYKNTSFDDSNGGAFGGLKDTFTGAKDAVFGASPQTVNDILTSGTYNALAKGDETTGQLLTPITTAMGDHTYDGHERTISSSLDNFDQQMNKVNDITGQLSGQLGALDADMIQQFLNPMAEYATRDAERIAKETSGSGLRSSATQNAVIKAVNNARTNLYNEAANLALQANKNDTSTLTTMADLLSRNAQTQADYDMMPEQTQLDFLKDWNDSKLMSQMNLTNAQAAVAAQDSGLLGQFGDLLTTINGGK